MATHEFNADKPIFVDSDKDEFRINDKGLVMFNSYTEKDEIIILMDDLTEFAEWLNAQLAN